MEVDKKNKKTYHHHKHNQHKHHHHNHHDKLIIYPDVDKTINKCVKIGEVTDRYYGAGWINFVPANKPVTKLYVVKRHK